MFTIIIIQFGAVLVTCSNQSNDRPKHQGNSLNSERVVPFSASHVAFDVWTGPKGRDTLGNKSRQHVAGTSCHNNLPCVTQVIL